MNAARFIDRYAIYGVIASGGMATVHFGRLVGPGGFSRTVAIKRLHPELADDPVLVGGMVDEARLVARIRHPNVVPTLDVVDTGSEVLVVMDYVAGETLSRLHRLSLESDRMPVPIAAAILADVLRGLQAAHDARDERGMPLGIVHRDVSPQNILVGSDGVSRILDFGVAKAEGRSQTTSNGIIKGKIAYMSPEQIQAEPVTLQTDLFAAAIVLWELLTGRRLFAGSNAVDVAIKVISGAIDPPSWVAFSRANEVAAYDALVARGLSRDPEQRFASARQMREALEACGPIASPVVVADWVQNVAHEALSHRARALGEIERSELSCVRPVREPGASRAQMSSIAPVVETHACPAQVHGGTSLPWSLVALLGAIIVALLLVRQVPVRVASVMGALASMESSAAAQVDAAPAPRPSSCPVRTFAEPDDRVFNLGP